MPQKRSVTQRELKMRYKRFKIAGGTYFFTVVTYERRIIFESSDNIELLRRAFKHVKKKRPFLIDAFVLLPDHIHCIWTLPEDDFDYSTRWRLIKYHFTKNCPDDLKSGRSESRLNKKEQPIWQRRFWEHLIRDEDDYRNHIEYIHLNPVKHGYVEDPMDWQYSSIHRYNNSRDHR